MATQATYYLDAPSLGSASVIYSDASLSTIAPNGFYSDGTIVREQVGGILLPQVNCPACAIECGTTIEETGLQGVYLLDINLGATLGAVIITFDPISIPDGFQATYDSVVYNGVSSPNYGWLQGSIGLPTYLGAISSSCGLPADSPYVLPIYEYQSGSFVLSGMSESVTILSGQLELTTIAPGVCVMVIPKTAASPSILTLKMIGPCLGTAFDLSISCPTALDPIECSIAVDSPEAVCLMPITETYYLANVTGTAGVVTLYDLVFEDAFGETKLPSAYYRTIDAGVENWFLVDSNGVVAALGQCEGDIAQYGASLGIDAPTACGDSGTPITVIGDNPLFCLCTQFVSSDFETYSTDVYYLSFNGFVVEISVTFGSDTATVTSPCVSC
jgi:hypothetical protein